MDLDAQLEVTLGGAFEDYELLEEDVAPALENFTNRVLDVVRADWPVDTGLSLASWFAEPISEPGAVGVQITNDATDPRYNRAYAAYVHRAGDDPGNKVWIEKFNEIFDNELPILMDEILKTMISKVGV